jgi:hypothetical protein
MAGKTTVAVSTAFYDAALTPRVRQEAAGGVGREAGSRRAGRGRSQGQNRRRRRRRRRRCRCHSRSRSHRHSRSTGSKAEVVHAEAGAEAASEEALRAHAKMGT